MGQSVCERNITTRFGLMQSASRLPPVHPVNQMTGLAKSIALPNAFAPQRYPSFPALERTAVMGFSAPCTLSTPSGATKHVMVARQAGWPLWAEGANDATPWSYAVHYYTDSSQNTAVAADVSYRFSTGLGPWYCGTITATGVSVGVAGSSVPPFTYAVLGLDSGTGSMPWTFVPYSGSSVFVVGTPNVATTASNIRLTYEVWTSCGETLTASVNGTVSASTGGTSFTIAPGVTSPYGIWVRPFSLHVVNSGGGFGGQFMVAVVGSNSTLASYATSATNVGTVTLGATVAPTFAPVVAPAEFSNSVLPWSSTRTTAVAALFTNVTPVLNKGGTVLAGRVAPQVTSPWAVTTAIVNNLHPAEKAYLPYETGAYTYVPPSTDLATFWDYTLPYFGGASFASPIYRLDNDSLVNHLFFTSPSNYAETLAITLDWHIEFRTSSALFPIGLSTMTLESFHQAQLALTSAGFFFENPEHKSILQRVIAALKRYGPNVAALVHPGLGAALRAGVQMLDRSPVQKMQATSAAASGIVSAPKKAPGVYKPKKKTVKVAKKKRK